VTRGGAVGPSSGPYELVPDPLAADVETEAPLAAVDRQAGFRASDAGGTVPERQGDAMGLGRWAVGVERSATGGIGARHDPACSGQEDRDSGQGTSSVRNFRRRAGPHRPEIVDKT
jgi:hypothetical protein